MSRVENDYFAAVMRYLVVMFVLSNCLGFTEINSNFEEPTGTVTGTLRAEGMSRYLGHAALWKVELGTPAPSSFIIVPDFVEDIDQSGTFTLKATPGHYYLGGVVRKRIGSVIGPPQPGDLIFMLPEIAGQALQVEVKAGETTDVGVQASAWEYQGFVGRRGARLKGQVVDEEGKPVVGVMVFANVSDARGQIPSGVSDKTDEEGRFLLPLAKPEQVFLNRVRKKIDGTAPVDERYQVLYPNDMPEFVDVQAGVPQDVKVVVRRLPSNESGQGKPLGVLEPRR